MPIFVFYEFESFGAKVLEYYGVDVKCSYHCVVLGR